MCENDAYIHCLITCTYVQYKYGDHVSLTRRTRTRASGCCVNRAGYQSIDRSSTACRDRRVRIYAAYENRAKGKVKRARDSHRLYKRNIIRSEKSAYCSANLGRLNPLSLALSLSTSLLSTHWLTCIKKRLQRRT